jgi:hypothetical protein
MVNDAFPVFVSGVSKDARMILRTWRGWTSTPEAAEAYEKLLNGTIAPAIMRRGVAGLRDLSVFRRMDGDDDTEFLTVMTFDDWAAVTEFAGPDATASVVPDQARAILARHDEHSQHYELLARHLDSRE